MHTNLICRTHTKVSYATKRTFIDNWEMGSDRFRYLDFFSCQVENHHPELARVRFGATKIETVNG